MRFGEVLGGRRFLMSFGTCKKSTKNDKSSTLGRPKDAFGDFFGRVGGRGGGPGNLVLLVLGQVSKNV